MLENLWGDSIELEVLLGIEEEQMAKQDFKWRDFLTQLFNRAT